MRPTLDEVIRLAKDPFQKDLFARLWAIRQSRSSRYAPRIKPVTSQRQRRRDHRRSLGHRAHHRCGC